MPLHRGCTGVLVVRVWVADDPEARILARVTRTLDVERPEALVTSVCPAEDVAVLVRSWLGDYLQALPGSDPPR
jgi:hypothetical protein